MDAADNRVGFRDELIAGCRGDDRGVVEQPICAWEPLRQRREIMSDKLKLAGQARAPIHATVAPVDAGRRATASTTSPVSSCGACRPMSPSDTIPTMRFWRFKTGK